jgi:hypothetical protein
LKRNAIKRVRKILIKKIVFSPKSHINHATLPWAMLYGFLFTCFRTTSDKNYRGVVFSLFDTIPRFLFCDENKHKDFGLLRLFQDLKQLHIDAFADLHNVLRSKVVRTFFLTGKKSSCRR